MNEEDFPLTISKEQDPTGKGQHEPGAKLDQGKAPIYRGAIAHFPRAVDAVARLSAFGADKYTWDGWKSVPEGRSRYSDAMVRHLTAHAKGEVLDPSSGFEHLAHAAWNAFAVLELYLIEKEQTNNATQPTVSN